MTENEIERQPKDEISELAKLIKAAYKIKINEKMRWEIIKTIQNQINRLYED